jgi:hypothetical protein
MSNMKSYVTSFRLFKVTLQTTPIKEQRIMGDRYSIDITGQTLTGDTSFPSANTTYTPLEQFSESGILTIESPILAANNNSDANTLDVGLYGGVTNDVDVLAGEIWWASNSAVHYSNRDITGVSESLSAQSQLLPVGESFGGIDEVTQVFDPETNTLTIEINDPNTALGSNIDNFYKSSSILSAPGEIVAGTITLQFSPDRTQVSGSATFIANGYIEPGASAWQGEFTGVLTDNFVGVAETI